MFREHDPSPSRSGGATPARVVTCHHAPKIGLSGDYRLNTPSPSRSGGAAPARVVTCRRVPHVNAGFPRYILREQTLSAVFIDAKTGARLAALSRAATKVLATLVRFPDNPWVTVSNPVVMERSATHPSFDDARRLENGLQGVSSPLSAGITG